MQTFAAASTAAGRNRRVVAFEELRERFGISYSRQHLHRRAGEGTFPKPVKLGTGKFARRVWREDDILQWLDQQAAGGAEAGHD